MKLNEKEKRILKSWGYMEEDFPQIEEAAKKTTYTLYNELNGRKKRIGIKEAIELLGIEDFLSGLSRSAFHWSACRQIGDSSQSVGFDSSKLFR